MRDHGGRLLLRGYETYVGAKAALREGRLTDQGLPVPPARLRATVVGHTDAQVFLESGRRENQLIREALGRAGHDVHGLRALLDWGCGCGRLIRWWSDLDGTEVHGCDYNPALVRWVQRNLPFVTAKVNQLAPPLPYDDDSFELIYALSVFTHLDDELAIEWMREIRRVLAPGGCFFFTTHGRAFRDRLSDEDAARFDRGESVVQFAGVEGTNLCAAYQPRSWVESRLAGELEVVEVVEAHTLTSGERDVIAQDRYLVRKPQGARDPGNRPAA